MAKHRKPESGFRGPDRRALRLLMIQIAVWMLSRTVGR